MPKFVNLDDDEVDDYVDDNFIKAGSEDESDDDIHHEEENAEDVEESIGQNTQDNMEVAESPLALAEPPLGGPPAIEARAAERVQQPRIIKRRGPYRGKSVLGCLCAVKDCLTLDPDVVNCVSNVVGLAFPYVNCSAIYVGLDLTTAGSKQCRISSQTIIEIKQFPRKRRQERPQCPQVLVAAKELGRRIKSLRLRGQQGAFDEQPTLADNDAETDSQPHDAMSTTSAETPCPDRRTSNRSDGIDTNILIMILDAVRQGVEVIAKVNGQPPPVWPQEVVDIFDQAKSRSPAGWQEHAEMESAAESSDSW